MAEEFDPYRKWLGIPPDEQPPHHYRLLGIALFEDDPDVIENAADRQMKHVRTFQTGKHGPLSQRLLNELSSAKVCLLTPADRAAYDDGLQAELAKKSPGLRPSAPARPAAAPRPAVPPPPVAEPLAPPPAPEAIPVGVAPVVVNPIGVSVSPRISIPQSAPQALPTGVPAGIPAGISTSRPIAVETPTAPAPGEDFPGTVRTSASPRLRGDRGSAWPMILGVGGLVGVGLVILAVLLAGGFGGSGKPSGGAGDNMPVRPVPTPPRTTTKFPKPGEGTSPPATTPGGTETIPPPMPTPPAVKDLATELASARLALGRRDRDSARLHLVDARVAAGSNERELEQVERLEALSGYLTSFWQAVRRAITSAPLKDASGQPQPFVFNYRVRDYNREYTLLRWEGEYVTYSVEDRERTVKISDLPPRDAVAFAASPYGLPANHPWTNIYVGTFYLLDAQDRELERDRQRIAERRWRDAKEGGVANVHLARELGIERELPPNFDPRPVPPGELVASSPSVDPMTPDTTPPMPSPMTPSTMPPVAGSNGRAPRPSAADETGTVERIRKSYDAALLKARTDDDALVVLVKTLYTDAKKEQDPLIRFGKLALASDLALQASRIEAGLLIVDEMAVLFELDPVREKIARLGKLRMPSIDPERAALVATEATTLFAAAAGRHYYDLAEEAAKIALAASIAAGDVPGQRKAREAQDAVKEVAAEQKVAESRMKMLEMMPDDATSNFLVGKYKCWGENDWAVGLPMLAKGNDKDLADMAAHELAAPTTPAEKLKVAENWFLYSKRRKGIASDNIVAHAQSWFQQAAAGDDPAVKMSAEKRLREIRDAQPLPVAAPLPKE